MLVGIVVKPIDLRCEFIDLGGELGVVGEVEPAEFGYLGLKFDERALELHDVARLAHEASPVPRLGVR